MSLTNMFGCLTGFVFVDIEHALGELELAYRFVVHRRWRSGVLGHPLGEKTATGHCPMSIGVECASPETGEWQTWR